MKINLFNLYTVHIKKHPKQLSQNAWYVRDFNTFKRLSGVQSEFPIADNYPCLNDKFDDSGVANGAYFHQDLFVAKQIYTHKPTKHVDIGSRIDGFIAHVAVFRPIEIFDIRKLDSKVENISFIRADLMSDNFNYIDYCDSISCLHALEHFGLGRYGDDIDPNGHLKGFQKITQMLKKAGMFYFSVPMGIQRIEFNAHRIFSLSYLYKWVTKDFNIISFSFVDDNGDLNENIQLSDEVIDSSCGCNHGCGIFVLQKKI